MRWSCAFFRKMPLCCFFTTSRKIFKTFSSPLSSLTRLSSVFSLLCSCVDMTQGPFSSEKRWNQRKSREKRTLMGRGVFREKERKVREGEIVDQSRHDWAICWEEASETRTHTPVLKDHHCHPLVISQHYSSPSFPTLMHRLTAALPSGHKHAIQRWDT